jgi:hypothetical protein
MHGMLPHSFQLRSGCRASTLRSVSSLAMGRHEGAPAAESNGCSRLSGAMQRTVPDFRCDMLDERGGILVSADIIAETPEAGIRHAAGILCASNESSSPRRVNASEVWSGGSRLFPPL